MFIHEIDENSIEDTLNYIKHQKKINLIIYFDEFLNKNINYLWLYNRSFYSIKKHTNKIICIGKRKHDFLFKLKLDNLNAHLCESIDEALKITKNTNYNTHILLSK